MTDWYTEGPRVLDWFRTELPHRASMVGVYADARAALGFAGSPEALRIWFARRPEWSAIRRTLGTATSPAVTASGGSLSSGTVPRRTLEQFLLDKRKAYCPVCKFPAEVRAILKRASEKGSAKVAEQIGWLREDCGATVTASELTTHRSGGHET